MSKRTQAGWRWGNGRIVGNGMYHDRYDEESNADTEDSYTTRVITPGRTPEELTSLSGPCITIVPAKELLR